MSCKPDLTDVTFCIPLRVDSPERMRNLAVVLEYLTANLDTRISLLEDGPRRLAPRYLPGLLSRVAYVYRPNESPLFARARLANIMAGQAETPMIVLHDTDVLASPGQYEACARLIRSGRADLASPFSGMCLDVPQEAAAGIQTSRSLEGVDPEACGRLPHAPGGVVFFDREVFFQGGMENENFVSYGFLDDERLIRFTRLGYRLVRLDGVLHHLSHPRGVNSSLHLNPHKDRNAAEARRVRAMTPKELREYVDSWPWPAEHRGERG
jgi:hypothetical protein